MSDWIDGALAALGEPQPTLEDYRTAAREILDACAEMRRADYLISWQEAAARASRRRHDPA